MNAKILLTGNPGKGIWEAVRALQNRKVRVTVAASELLPASADLQKHYFELSETKDTLSTLYKTGDFDTVVFFVSCQNLLCEGSSALYGKQLDWLMENLRQLEISTGVNRCILVTDSRVFGAKQEKDESTVPVPDTFTGSLLRLAETEFFSYKREAAPLEKMLIRTTHLYASSDENAFADSFSRTYDTVTFAGTELDGCNLISYRDFADLLYDAIAAEDCGTIHAFNGVKNYIGDLIKYFNERNIKTLLQDQEGQDFSSLCGTAAEKRLDWVCYNDYAALVREGGVRKEEKQRILGAHARFREKLGKLVAPLETAVGTVLMQLLVRVTETYTVFNIVDARLLFTVVIGSVHGAFWGCIAGLVAYASFCISYLTTTGGVWDLLLNMDNWLPLVLYLLGGEITGYLKTSSDNKASEMKKEISSKEEELDFLRMLHRSTCDQRDMLKEQIIKSRESYGKVYRITGELDVLQPDEITFKAVRVLEDVLDCHSVTIYYRENENRYIRKIAESPENYTYNIPYSLNIENYPLMWSEIEQNQLFVNKNLMPDYPAYCVTDSLDSNITLVVMLWRVEYKQFTKYYQNLLCNTTSLISRFFKKAIEYQNAPERYIPGTSFLKHEEFLKAWQVRRQMRMEHTGQYVLFKVSSALPDEVLDERLKKITRSLDIVGKTRDGIRYMLMMQADETAVPHLQKRFLSRGIYVKYISDNDLHVYLE